jgi:hypothetical protein
VHALVVVNIHDQDQFTLLFLSLQFFPSVLSHKQLAMCRKSDVYIQFGLIFGL